MQGKNILKMPIQYVKGVGPKKSQLLGRLGIFTPEDVLYNLPRRYEDRTNFTPISKVTVGQHCAIKGEVLTYGVKRTKRGLSVFQVAVGDDTGVIYGIWFNQPYLRQYFKVGQRIIMYGKVELYDVVVMPQPEYEFIEDQPDEDSLHMGRIVPIYSLTKELTQRYLRSLTKKVIDEYGRFLVEIMPTKIRARNKLVDIKFAINNIHFPVSDDALKRAYRRIIFEEFFIIQLAVALKRKGIREKEGLRHQIEGELVESFKRSVPFQLTDGQKAAMAMIEQDMQGYRPMNRLLEGEVGSGKTIVAAYAMVLTVQNGYQGVFMVPTEILAEQHFFNLNRWLGPLGINVELLINGTKEPARQRIKEQLSSGEIDIIVGTHTLIQDDVIFKRLGLCVIDEQHKFGVTQRNLLRKKGQNPHILIMTATPIPRTLALTVFGDLDVSVIKELPPGRRPVSTYWVEEQRRDSVYEFVKEQLRQGHQAYIVYPRVYSEKGGSDDIKSATSMFEILKEKVFSNFKVGLLHGQLSSEQKEKVISDFKNGQIDVLVSTILVEVGIDVPNASVMVVENAERFGLSQLHQLRGRIGRGEFDSYCILLSNPKTSQAKRRLQAMTETLDGFAIAEEDLQLRGPGEIFGTRQHGIPELRFGSVVEDADIMELARKEAFAIIAEDPELSHPQNRHLRENLTLRFKGRLDLISVG